MPLPDDALGTREPGEHGSELILTNRDDAEVNAAVSLCQPHCSRSQKVAHQLTEST
jgi:hypothetical protein